MKVKEIRELLKGYTEKEKDNIIVELYNKFPKRMREDKEIDLYLKNASVKKEKLLMTFDDHMIDEIETFISDASEGLYASPNKIIPKAERSKWRFKVKKFYKLLTSISVDSPLGDLATDYLIQLFDLLDYGTTYLKFTTWETFSSIGISQIDYLSTLYDRILSSGRDEENLTKCAKLSLIHADRYTFYTSGITELSYHTSKEERIKLIDILNKEIKDLDGNKIYNEYMIESYYEGMLFLYFTSDLIDEGIKNYLDNVNDSLQTNLYVILRVLNILEFNDEWIKVYERYQGKVDYREDLKEEYKRKKGKK